MSIVTFHPRPPPTKCKCEQKIYLQKLENKVKCSIAVHQNIVKFHSYCSVALVVVAVVVVVVVVYATVAGSSGGGHGDGDGDGDRSAFLS